MEQAQLYSCLDLIRDRMGDAITEQAAIDTILASNFNAEKALDQLLNSPVTSTKSTVREKSPLPPSYQGINLQLILIKKTFKLYVMYKF